jgi:uncharacterized membrane protein YeaQ/YmgE (transglycosylase-associated protein family)
VQAAPCQCRLTARNREEFVSNIIWIVVIGFLAGIVARILSPGPNNPSGFILTIVLGVAGAFSRRSSDKRLAGIALIKVRVSFAATVGALVVLFIWNRLVARNAISDPGAPAGPRRWL